MSDGAAFYELFNPPAPPTPAARPVEVGEATTYAAAALRREAETLANTSEGSRNAALNTAAFRMGRHVGAGNIDEHTVTMALSDAGRACGLTQGEIDTTLRLKNPNDPTSPILNGAAHPRHPTPRVEDVIPQVTTLDVPVNVETGEPDLGAFIRTQFPLVDWHTLWTTEAEDDEWILEPIIPARRLIALYSPPKKGKSLLMLEMAVGIARGTPCLGRTPDKRRVLYVDFENDPRGDIMTRLQAMGHSWEDIPDLCYLSYPTMAKLDTPQGAAELIAITQEYDCELVVIDTISRAVAGDENENDTWLSFYRNTGLALKQAGVACIRLDHTGKDHDKGMRGGSAKYGDVDAVWKLTAVTDDVFRLDCTDHRMPLTETEITITRRQNPLRHDVHADGRAAATDAKVAQVIDVLDQLDIPDTAGRDKCRTAVKTRGLSASNYYLGLAIKTRQQRAGLHYSPEDATL